jgi:hypothetical protein
MVAHTLHKIKRIPMLVIELKVITFDKISAELGALGLCHFAAVVDRPS